MNSVRIVNLSSKKLRDDLLAYWNDNPSSMAKLARDMNISTLTLKRFLEGKKKVSFRMVLIVDCFLKNKGFFDEAV